MPRRTTLPLWNIPTSGPSGPHTPEELLLLNEYLRPWADLLTRMTDARTRQMEVLNQLREAAIIAPQVVRAGALTNWIEGMTSDAAMMFESFESCIVALDRYISRAFDDALTNTALDAMPQPKVAPYSRTYPILTESLRSVTKRRDR